MPQVRMRRLNQNMSWWTLHLARAGSKMELNPIRYLRPWIKTRKPHLSTRRHHHRLARENQTRVKTSRYSDNQVVNLFLLITTIHTKISTSRMCECLIFLMQTLHLRWSWIQSLELTKTNQGLLLTKTRRGPIVSKWMKIMRSKRESWSQDKKMKILKLHSLQKWEMNKPSSLGKWNKEMKGQFLPVEDQPRQVAGKIKTSNQRCKLTMLFSLLLQQRPKEIRRRLINNDNTSDIKNIIF